MDIVPAAPGTICKLPSLRSAFGTMTSPIMEWMRRRSSSDFVNWCRVFQVSYNRLFPEGISEGACSTLEEILKGISHLPPPPLQEIIKELDAACLVLGIPFTSPESLRADALRLRQQWQLRRIGRFARRFLRPRLKDDSSVGSDEEAIMERILALEEKVLELEGSHAEGSNAEGPPSWRTSRRASRRTAPTRRMTCCHTRSCSAS